MKEYYFSQLNSREQDGYRKLLWAIENGESSVKFGLFMNKESLTKIATAINYDHPELFYVDFRHLNFLTMPVGIVYQINYNVKPVFRRDVVNDLEKKIRAIVENARLEGLKNNYDKCRWIHNYLVKNIRYNYNALKCPDDYPEAFGIDGVFNNRVAVCEGIAKAFKLLCDQLNVDALIVFGTSSLDNIGQEIPHAWNMVQLNGEYTHIDVTWDIGVSEPSKHTRFDYFCISDAFMKKDHVFDDFPKCETDKYSYFRKRGRWFSGSKQLKEYLKKELEKGSNILYFKVDNGILDINDLHKKIQNQVNKEVSLNIDGTYWIEMVPNVKQNCFFFRIKR